MNVPRVTRKRGANGRGVFCGAGPFLPVLVIAVLLAAQTPAPGCACPGCPKEPGYELLMIGELMTLGPEIAGMSIADALLSQAGESPMDTYGPEINARFTRLGLGAVSYASPEEGADADAWDPLVRELAETVQSSLGTAETREDFERIVNEVDKAFDAAFTYWEFRDYDRKVFAVRSWLLALNFVLAADAADAGPIREGLLRRWRELEETESTSTGEKAKLQFIRRSLESPPLAAPKPSEGAREAAAALAEDFRLWLDGSVLSRLPEAIRAVESNFDRNNPEKVARDFRGLILLMGHLERLEDKEAEARLRSVAEALESIAVVTHGGFLPDTIIDRVPAELAAARRFFAGRPATEPAPTEKDAPETARRVPLRIWLFAGVAFAGAFAMLLAVLRKRALSHARPTKDHAP